jgi:hypothetical protein
MTTEPPLDQNLTKSNYMVQRPDSDKFPDDGSVNDRRQTVGGGA